MIGARVVCLLLFFGLCHCYMYEDGWFEAEIVREMSFAYLYPNQTLEGRCVAKGFPQPSVFFINEYIDFDFDYEDVTYTYSAINDTFSETRMIITDPAYAAYMPILHCEAENEAGWGDSAWFDITRL